MKRAPFRRSARAGLLCMVVASFAPLAPAPAAAQYRVQSPSEEPSDADMQRARARFLEGAELAEAGRWADALERFESAHSLSGLPVTLFNVATALRALGRYRDARDAFDALLADVELDSATREEATERREEVAARVAVLVLDDVPGAPDVSIELDGQPAPTGAARPIELETDPGSHTATVGRPAHLPFRWAGDLASGERRRVSVVLEAVVPEMPRPVWRSPALWIVVGVVVIGAGVATGVVLQNNAQLDAMSDNVVHL